MRFFVNGFFPAMVTPLTRDGDRLDLEQTDVFVNWLLESGADGFFLCGTSGEGPLLSMEERLTLTRRVVPTASRAKKPVLVQITMRDQRETIDMAQRVQQEGADAAVLLTPGFFPYDDHALKRFFTAVAESAPELPFLLYNIPQCAQNSISTDLVLDLARSVENIVGLKDSSGDMARFTRIIADAPDEFTLLCGSDSFIYQALHAGADGVVSGPSNVAPECYAGLCRSLRAGNSSEAWRQQVCIDRLQENLFKAGMVAAYKEGLRWRGIETGGVRRPQRELLEFERRNLHAALYKQGFRPIAR